MRNPNCTDCGLHQLVTNRCVWGNGPLRAKLMFVGEAPGAEEDKEGRPFVGAAGKLLTELLSQSGIAREEVYITNVSKCRPPLNRTPTPQEADTCLHYLLEEIETIRPELIVCLGGSAMLALTGSKRPIAQEHGKLMGRRRGVQVPGGIMATYHPAALLRPEGKKYLSPLLEDLKFAASFVAGEEKASGPKHKKYLIGPNTSEDEAVASLHLLKDAKYVAVDLEWTSSKESMVWPWSGRGSVYTASLTALVEDEYVSVALSWPLTPRARRIVEWMLRTKGLIFHNAMADGLWLRWAGVPDYSLTFDTMLLAYLHDEAQPLALEKVAPKYAPELAQGWKGHLFEREPAFDAQWIELLDYNANDTFATYRAWEGLAAAIKKESKERREAIVRLHRHLLLPAVKVLQHASYVGIPIDQERLAQEKAAAEGRRMEAAERLAGIAGTTLNGALTLANSSDRTLQYLKGALGLELLDSQKDNLSDYVQYPAVAAILDVRREQKLLSTYLAPWSIMLARQRDGRLHSVYRPTGTRTGRLSAESEIGGSIQVAPRDTEFISFRQLIRAQPGMKIVSADYSQVELRMVAWIANEPTMLQFYREGVDLHTATAAYFLACRNGLMPIEEFWPNRDQWMARVTKAQRQAGKPGNFGLAYGMQPAGLMDYARTQYQVTMTLQEAEQMHAGYFKLYAAIPPWHDRAMADANRLGYTETVWGRRRKFDQGDVHAAINTPVQSTASDFTLKAMIHVAGMYEDEGLSATVIGFVHDSIMAYASEKDAQRAGDLLKYAMENVDTSQWGFRLPIPLPADVKISEYWS